MCEYKSFGVEKPVDDQPARILFYEEDSHEEIIRRAGWRDGDNHIRHFVRVECRPPFITVRVDESEVPGWYHEARPEIDQRVIALALNVNALREEYDAKWAALDEEYAPKRAALREEYDAKWAALREEYAPKWAALREEYAPKWAALDEEYAPKRAALDEEYDAKLSKIEGYLPALS